MEPYLGELRIFPYNFSPRGWMICSGQILSIAQNAALFSILGTTYGGNGQTTFSLPDLRGRVPIHMGNNSQTYVLGEVAGTTSVTLTSGNLPLHSHNLIANTNSADVIPAAGAMLASTTALQYGAAAGNTPVPMALASISGGPNGASPISIVQPYLAFTICIATEGIFPSRN
ncbi:phage tail protein [Pedobacter sp. MR2016-24]|uniref:phage tail protein n=1 Tax=Pedobacter sp. MR2016-24 TaxID=2994466 RepID=UPI002247AA56|nr:tail fiber protein [Pedobacter sp. MR2016-24]MCX2484890.1 tail fiber protein [Pedobacter sp. MR2016-24]